jgi:hypothetical protein
VLVRVRPEVVHFLHPAIELKELVSFVAHGAPGQIFREGAREVLREDEPLGLGIAGIGKHREEAAAVDDAVGG